MCYNMKNYHQEKKTTWYRCECEFLEGRKKLNDAVSQPVINTHKPYIRVLISKEPGTSHSKPDIYRWCHKLSNVFYLKIWFFLQN